MKSLPYMMQKIFAMLTFLLQTGQKVYVLSYLFDNGSLKYFEKKPIQFYVSIYEKRNINDTGMFLSFTRFNCAIK
jgi:hypothetical protein